MNMRLLALLACVPSARPCSPRSPAAMLQQWRTSRIQQFGTVLDASRYHVQVLFVDGDGYRARTCAAMLERVASWALGRRGRRHAAPGAAVAAGAATSPRRNGMARAEIRISV